ncbi:MAG TPA: DUF1330 domain-containing protein [Gallionella sp.]|nr:DUF1330 domain-containing protein [Gallionella sp.]
MPKGYWIVRAGQFENHEGASRTRNAVIEFPSCQAALDCRKLPEYRQAIKLRQPVSILDLVIIEETKTRNRVELVLRVGCDCPWSSCSSPAVISASF